MCTGLTRRVAAARHLATAKTFIFRVADLPVLSIDHIETRIYHSKRITRCRRIKKNRNAESVPENVIVWILLALACSAQSLERWVLQRERRQ